MRDASTDENSLDPYSQAVVQAVDVAGPAVVRVEVPAEPGRRRRGGTGSGVVIFRVGLVLSFCLVGHG